MQSPKYVIYRCPHCDEKIEVDYDNFREARISDSWPEWEEDIVTCDECGEKFIIWNVVLD